MPKWLDVTITVTLSVLLMFSLVVMASLLVHSVTDHYQTRLEVHR